MPNRPERRSRPVSLAPVIALTILAAGLAIAQQNVPARAPAAEPAAEAADEAAAEAADETAAEGGNPSAAAAGAADPNVETKEAKPADAKGSPQRFEPTEKVRPDFDVAFPVDI